MGVSSQASTPGSEGSRLWLLCVAAITAVHGVFLAGWAEWMWSRDHYQFYPLVLAGFAYLIWSRLPSIEWLKSGPRFSVRVGLYLAASAGLFFLATRSGSHWFGLLSFLVCLWASVWYAGSNTAAKELRGPMLLWALIVPLPLNLDLQVIIGMQKLASWLASGMLDLKLARHTISGVAIRTAEKSYMVEEACSGIHSLFSATSAMLFFAVWCRYGLVRVLLTISHTVGWVLLANAVRVFALVYSDWRFDVPLDDGWRHDALGVATYVLALGFALSTDQLIRFIFPLVGQGTLTEVHREFRKRVQEPWEKTVQSVFDLPSFGGKVAVIIPMAVFIVAYLPLGGMAVARQFRDSPNSQLGTAVELADGAVSIPESAVASGIPGWEKTGFELRQRDPDDPFGMTSSIWTFEGHGLTVLVSVDGYYPEWHDLAYCYLGSGWKLQDGRNEIVGEAPNAVPHTELYLYKDAGDLAIVFFSCFDSQLAAVQPPAATGDFLRTLKNRFQALGFESREEAVVVPPVFQVQLMLQSVGEVHEHEVAALKDLFLGFRSQVLDSLREGGAE